MRLGPRPAVLSAAAGLLMLWQAGGLGAQSVSAAGPEAAVTEEGLHRVDPSIMEAAWIKPELDLLRFTRILLLPTAVQFRDIPERRYDARSRQSVSEFPLDDEQKEWFSQEWRNAVETEFARQQTYDLYDGVGNDVLLVQAFLVDVVSHIPPDEVGSNYTLVRDPWTVNVVLELRDGMTAELLARTIDQRHAQGLVEAGMVWVQTENLLERWADVAFERLHQLVDLGEGGRRTPAWAR